MPTGKSKSPTHSVSDYPKKYKSIDELLGEDFLLTLEDTFGEFLRKRQDNSDEDITPRRPLNRASSPSS